MEKRRERLFLPWVGRRQRELEVNKVKKVRPGNNRCEEKRRGKEEGKR